MSTSPAARSLSGALVALAVATLLVAMTGPSASAQYYGQGSNSTFAVSFAYSGDANGVRLEMDGQKYIYDIGYFNADRSTIYAAEVGYQADQSAGESSSIPLVLGLGYYYESFDASNLSTDGDTSLWIGGGDFSPTRKGFFYQARYIFSGALGGAQGVLGWAF